LTLDGGELSASCLFLFTLGKEPLVPIEFEGGVGGTGWTVEPVGIWWRQKEIPCPC